uniref:Uncharacterized protein n=1 Tax=Ascaris lumbricoides TaxID=6252 RepID=A0A0M3IMZ6_ASCLU
MLSPISPNISVTCLQKAHRCLGQLPPQFNSDPLDTPSSTSPASLRPSTFGSRPYMTNSTTMETDLNSPHSSVMTERNTADFSRNDGFPLHPNTESAIFTNIHQSERESYSILCSYSQLYMSVQWSFHLICFELFKNFDEIVCASKYFTNVYKSRQRWVNISLRSLRREKFVDLVAHNMPR